MREIKTVALIGLGAVGMMYAAELQKSLGRENLYIIADEERIARYRKEGLRVNGTACEFQLVSPGEVPQVDLLLFATKYYGLPDAIRQTKAACGPDTIVISMLNGISSEEMIRERLSPEHLLYCSVQGMDATRNGTSVDFTTTGWIAFGTREEALQPDVEAVKALLDTTSIRYTTPEDIMHQLWSKWMLNVGLNQACATYATNYGGVQVPGEAREAMLRGMEEARAVAAAEGIDLTDEEVRSWMQVLDGLSAEGEPSMRQDMRDGRPTEYGLFCGEVCRLGEKHKILVPQNQTYLAFFEKRQ